MSILFTYYSLAKFYVHLLSKKNITHLRKNNIITRISGLREKENSIQTERHKYDPRLCEEILQELEMRDETVKIYKELVK